MSINVGDLFRVPVFEDNNRLVTYCRDICFCDTCLAKKKIVDETIIEVISPSPYCWACLVPKAFYCNCTLHATSKIHDKVSDFKLKQHNVCLIKEKALLKCVKVDGCW